MREWTFETKGAMVNPDCAVAAMLDKRYGLSHTMSPRSDFLPRGREGSRRLCRRSVHSERRRVESGALVDVCGIVSPSVWLNGMGAPFAESFGLVTSFRVLTQRRFRGHEVDFDRLADEQCGVRLNCFGRTDADRFFLKESGLDVVCDFGKYLFRSNFT